MLDRGWPVALVCYGHYTSSDIGSAPAWKTGITSSTPCFAQIDLRFFDHKILLVNMIQNSLPVMAMEPTKTSTYSVQVHVTMHVTLYRHRLQSSTSYMSLYFTILLTS